jgi:Zn-dependent protease
MLRRPGSFKLADVFGIRIGVDRTWFLILFAMIFIWTPWFRSELHSSDVVAYATTVVTVLVFFGSILFHELGHALVARRHGNDVTQIDLFLFGGMARMSRDARTPREEFQIAAAGPLATLVFVLACLAVDLVIVGPHRLLDAAELNNNVHLTPTLLALSWLLLWNILLLVFNLVPAFPLDGGRIARSIVWRITGDKTTGTRTAAKLGQGFAVLLAGLGIFVLVSLHEFTGLWLLAISFLLGQSARGILLQTELTERIEGVCVADIMDRQPVAIPASTPVTQALDDFYLRYGWSWFPVVDEADRFIGITRQERLQATHDAGEGWLTVGAVLESEEDGGWRVDQDRPLTEVLSSEPLGRLGALMAVDGEGVLRGVITIDQVRRALQRTVIWPSG